MGRAFALLLIYMYTQVVYAHPSNFFLRYSLDKYEFERHIDNIYVFTIPFCWLLWPIVHRHPSNLIRAIHLLGYIYIIIYMNLSSTKQHICVYLKSRFWFIARVGFFGRLCNTQFPTVHFCFFRILCIPVLIG